MNINKFNCKMKDFQKYLNKLNFDYKTYPKKRNQNVKSIVKHIFYFQQLYLHYV